jgi:hypothetical protein
MSVTRAFGTGVVGVVGQHAARDRSNLESWRGGGVSSLLGSGRSARIALRITVARATRLMDVWTSVVD